MVENASDDFPQQKELENILPNFAGSSPPISPKTSPTSLWKSLVLTYETLISHVLSGMFRGSASLAIPRRKSFAAIPSASLVLLGHTNRSVSVSHESQHGTALVLPLSRQIPYYQQGDMGGRHGPWFRSVCVFDVSRAVGIARFESVSEPRPNRTIQLGCTRRLSYSAKGRVSAF